MDWRTAAQIEQRAWFQGVVASIRGRDGCKKGDFARAIGVSTATLWVWEQGEGVPNREAMLRIRALLSRAAVIRGGRFVEL